MSRRRTAVGVILCHLLPFAAAGVVTLCQIEPEPDDGDVSLPECMDLCEASDDRPTAIECAIYCHGLGLYEEVDE